MPAAPRRRHMDDDAFSWRDLDVEEDLPLPEDDLGRRPRLFKPPSRRTRRPRRSRFDDD
ncbi:MAG: hypothetical protein ACE5O2_17595 [Armatimonadota bacterium]